MGRLQHLPEDQLLKMIDEEPELTVREYLDFLAEIQVIPEAMVAPERVKQVILGKAQFNREEAFIVVASINKVGDAETAIRLGVTDRVLREKKRLWKRNGWLK